MFRRVCLSFTALTTILLQYNVSRIARIGYSIRDPPAFSEQAYPNVVNSDEVDGRNHSTLGEHISANETLCNGSPEIRIEKSKPVIDILSTGSELLPELQTAQRETFGSHPQVRIFYAAQEKDDFHPECHKEMNDPDKLAGLVRFCRKDQPSDSDSLEERLQQRLQTRKTKQFPWLFDMRDYFVKEDELMAKKNPSGWLCAQTRPISALAKLVRRYRELALRLPDYLFLIDDDTYINMNRTLDYLTEKYPPEQQNAVAGCLLVWMQNNFFPIPFGGHGTILSRKSLELLTRPLICTQHFKSRENETQIFTSINAQKRALPPDTTADYEEFACSRILENRVNERPFFRDGMSLVELFEAYAKEQPFTDYANWNETGFCFHSDWITAYMVNSYEVGRYEPDHWIYNKYSKNNRLQTYEESVFFYGLRAPKNVKLVIVVITPIKDAPTRTATFAIMCPRIR